MTYAKLRALWRDARGVAAVEFAFIAPILAGLVVVSFGVWEAGAREQNLRSALRLGTQYYMNGGASDAGARTVAMGGWSKRPANGTVTTARMCRCGETASACNTQCPGDTPPSIYVTLSATAT